ncbi:5'-methylthioadenosine/S-adenosylhomocysteine nucleosidase [Spiroplasma turonicum]|uniref:5'-methylthioadenosine/S-adenosylhomocysteine nucleosidase n=1 Tax=Spiroplasma turonicum TaxID=216946 RepID=A0A0K1P5F9_9MOLU|nr:5'-methylthioadenosine/S-adenosylhomocysteine nucleosidase [Spiroplasma turonicum]AKU79536.1 5'-methylthioadenosine/S-adenosylhomocysteine nucleosidase [Spiroplasma turonicum]ALX70559.1 5'-methylthioadenosine/S-adenosylhomocysteine nucleosidase [Spiroplasma turonicum]
MIKSKSYYCFIFAMYEEAKTTIKNLNFQLLEKEPFEIYKKNDYYIVISKIGLINAATCFSYINTKYNFDYYINIGTACGVDKTTSIFEFFFIKKAFLGNVDATGFGYKFGQVPQMPEHYSSVNLLDKSLFNYKEVDICSSDIFINSNEKVNNVVYKIDKTIKLVDMESAALFQSAYLMQKNILSIKIISDIVGSNSNELDFNSVLKDCSERIYQLIKKFNI